MIRKIKINHLYETIGVDYNNLLFSFISDEEKINATLYLNNQVIESKEVSFEERAALHFETKFLPSTTYQLRINDQMVEFETAPIFNAPFITTKNKINSPIFYKEINIHKSITKARLYITGLGLYEANINGKKVGNRFLTPGFNDYDSYLRFQSYDVKPLLKEKNILHIALGDGWYMGRLGLDKKPGKEGKVFGDTYAVSFMLDLNYEDGTTEQIISDDTLKATSGITIASSIYDGEQDDYTKELKFTEDTVLYDHNYKLVPDSSAPIREEMTLTPELIITPKGEKVLDFKQNMVGFVRILECIPKGVKVLLKHGEILQQECFYNANLRTARAEASYVGNGINEVYETKFTFFGFRYVLVEGLEEVNPAHFQGVVIHSELDQVLECKTSNPLLNQLISNSRWGQRGNFLDVPTDCPQRDERLGWTADTQVFVNTACYFMDCYSFYKKYMQDLRADQQMYYNGDIPMYSPSLKHEAGNGGAVWADAGTIIPWNVFKYYGDKELLKENYPMMTDYVETLIKKDMEQGNRHLILYGFTFGDWLAQDGICAQSLIGGTDNGFIMSVYYYYSVKLCMEASFVLGHEENVIKYKKYQELIKNAILDEYFTSTGRFSLDTQCAYILVLKYQIYRNKETIINQLKERLRKDFYRMKTGFTGTPLLIEALIDAGLDEDAYRILFNEECPGWFYCIKLGATTIWERWNSVLPDGTISGINMNSLNHYSYGSVCESIFSRIAGLKNEGIGFNKVEIKPTPNYRLKEIDLKYDSVNGLYHVGWKIIDDKFILDVEIPYGCSADVILPNNEKYHVEYGKYHYEIECMRKLIYPFDLSTPNLDICNNELALDALRRNCPQAFFMVTGENEEFKVGNGYMLGSLRMFGTTKESMDSYEKELKNIKA